MRIPPRFERSQVAGLIERLAGPPRRITALFGPRQCGKTTIADQALASLRRQNSHRTLYRAADQPPPDAVREQRSTVGLVSALPDPKWIVAQWREARRLANERPPAVLVLDEIQLIPQWSTVVKGLWDEDRGLRHRPHIVLLGSVPLRIQQGLKESLAGRFAPLPVHHWSLVEMAAAFGFELQQFLFYGSYPGAADLTGRGRVDDWREAVLDGCVLPTVERDILGLTRVDKPVLMKRLFDLSAHYSGQIVSFTKLVGHLQEAGNTTTVARYLGLLEAAGLVAGLSNYARSPLRRRASPKLLVLNTALMTASSGHDPEEARADRSFWGRLVESAVGAHLYRTRRPGTSLHYWRFKGQEVDFVLQRGPHVLAVEVKSGDPRGPHSGLAAFGKKFPGARGLMVGAEGVPLVEFLAEPAERWLTERWE